MQKNAKMLKKHQISLDIIKAVFCSFLPRAAIINTIMIDPHVHIDHLVAMVKVVRYFVRSLTIRGGYIANPYSDGSWRAICGERWHTTLKKTRFILSNPQYTTINNQRGFVCARYNHPGNTITFYGTDVVTTEVIAHELQHMVQRVHNMRLSRGSQYHHNPAELNAFYVGILVNYITNYNIWDDLDFYSVAIVTTLQHRAGNTLDNTACDDYLAQTRELLEQYKALDIC